MLLGLNWILRAVRFFTIPYLEVLKQVVEERQA